MKVPAHALRASGPPNLFLSNLSALLLRQTPAYELCNPPGKTGAGHHYIFFPCEIAGIVSLACLRRCTAHTAVVKGPRSHAIKRGERMESPDHNAARTTTRPIPIRSRFRA
jgi:hypothetical protein